MGPRAHELRLALCMRGGVSLAVWMGGACREIAALRAARSSTPADRCDRVQQKIYEFLLRTCGYDTATIDIITGTSAGGLNGVLFATHLMYGTPFDSRIRDIWLRLGDLEGLSREPDARSPDSLLKGTDGFYTKVYEQLCELVPDNKAERSAARPRLLRLILTATRLYPRNEYLRTSIGTPMLVNWSRAHMVFRHHESGTTSTFTDFPEGDDGRNAALSRLAYAARTTSSFPAAFEPAEIEVAKGTGKYNFHGLISETCAPDLGSQGCVQLMDGGVLDNVPLAWAVRAIADAPANRAVDRWLLYLEPVSAEVPEPPLKGERSLARLAGVIRALVQAKANSESLLEDATELREAWTTAQKLRSTASGIPGDPSCVALSDVDLDRGRYAAAVARVEADRLARLIEDPISLVGPDPLPIPDTGKFAGNEPWPLLTCLRGDVDPCLVDTASFRSPFAAARAVVLALDWIQAAETGLGKSIPALEEPRGNLYKARFACEVLVASRDRLLLRTGSPALTDVLGWVRTADLWLRSFVEDEGGLQDFAVDTLAAVADLATSPEQLTGTPPEFADSLTTIIWNYVATQCLLVRTALEEAGAGVAPGFRAFAEAQDQAAMIRILTHAELVLGPLRPNPLAEPTLIRLHTINAAAQNTVFPDLPRDSKQRTNAKLSGNTLMNFASFLSARWRLNDWTWGRMDAAVALVDVVAQRNGFGFPGVQQELEKLYYELTAIDSRLQASPAKFPPPHEFSGAAVPGLLKRWLQWNIVRQEVPLLKQLQEARGGGDPPLNATEAAKAAEEAEKDAITETDAGLLRQVGRESVRDLLTRSSLRRTAMRLGLVAWRAVQPAGEGWARVVHGAFALFKPLVLPPVLIGFLAPVPSMVAAALSWITLTVATDEWVCLPGHLLVLAGAGVATACAVWRWWPNRKSVSATSAALLRGIGTAVVAIGGAFLWLHHKGDLAWSRPFVVMALTAVAVVTSLWSVTGPRRSVVTGMASGLLAGLVISAFPQPLCGVGAVLALYGALVIETFLLTWWFPKASG